MLGVVVPQTQHPVRGIAFLGLYMVMNGQDGLTDEGWDFGQDIGQDRRMRGQTAVAFQLSAGSSGLV